MQEEIWKDIKGFENIYRVSNYGRLSSNKRGGWRVLSTINSKGDYLSVVLRGKDNAKSAKMHRLVYEAFIGDIPKGRKFHVHHIDGNKQNNHVDNLILKTSLEHVKEHYVHILEIAAKRDYGVENGNINEYCKYIVENGKVVGLNPNYKFDYNHNQIRSKRKRKGVSCKPRKIEQYTLKGVFLNSYNNAKDAERKTGVCSRNILQVASKDPYNDKGSIRKQAGGYIWKFKEE